MTLKEAKELAQKQADEFGVTMIVVKDDLSEDQGGHECCAEMYRTTLYPDHHLRLESEPEARYREAGWRRLIHEEVQGCIPDTKKSPYSRFCDLRIML